MFFGWGICLALTSVFVAPRLARAVGRGAALTGALVLLAADLVVLAAAVTQLWVLVAGVVGAGLALGVLNTLLTESVMESTDLPRSVASSAYSGVRFFGGAVSAAVAGPIAAALGASAPYLVAAAALLASAAVLFAGRHHLAAIDRHLAASQ